LEHTRDRLKDAALRLVEIVRDVSSPRRMDHQGPSQRIRRTTSRVVASFSSARGSDCPRGDRRAVSRRSLNLPLQTDCCCASLKQDFKMEIPVNLIQYSVPSRLSPCK
jgi:hypothetical protein